MSLVRQQNKSLNRNNRLLRHFLPCGGGRAKAHLPWVVRRLGTLSHLSHQVRLAFSADQWRCWSSVYRLWRVPDNTPSNLFPNYHSEPSQITALQHLLVPWSWFARTISRNDVALANCHPTLLPTCSANAWTPTKSHRVSKNQLHWWRVTQWRSRFNLNFVCAPHCVMSHSCRLWDV